MTSSSPVTPNTPPNDPNSHPNHSQSSRIYATKYKKELLENVLPFWANHSIDRRYGGYFTCLDRTGKIYDTDKFIWLQNRQLWTFSMLCNQLNTAQLLGNDNQSDLDIKSHEIKQKWLDIATVGAAFLAKHGRDKQGNWYFSLNQAGQPLIQPYNIFSDCFAAMAFSQYAIALNQAQHTEITTHQTTETAIKAEAVEEAIEEAKEIALQAYNNVLRRQANPKGQYNKAYPGTRPLKSLAVPMILANLSLEMDWLLSSDQLEAVLTQTKTEVMQQFRCEADGLIYEHVSPEGEQVNCYEGRLINPGHGIEAMWFMMAIGERQGDRPLINQAIDQVIRILNFAWDEPFGGLFYFMDAQGHPPQQLEWDQKLWWVHLETLVALSMAYRLTGREDCWQWYQKVHNYTWEHFTDSEHGEWYGYLNRRGEVLLPLKGGKWKGCFHVPRALFLCWQQFDQISDSSAKPN